MRLHITLAVQDRGNEEHLITDLGHNYFYGYSSVLSCTGTGYLMPVRSLNRESDVFT